MGSTELVTNPLQAEVPLDRDFLLPICLNSDQLTELLDDLRYAGRRYEGSQLHTSLLLALRALAFIDDATANKPCEGGCTESETQFDCFTYSPTDNIVEWIPEIGEPIQGSTIPAWEQGDVSLPNFLETFKDLINSILQLAPDDPTVGSLLLGIERTDVVTTITSYSTALIEDFLDGFILDTDLPPLPEFRVHLSGSGVCELHFVTLPLGSFVAYSLDQPIDILTILSGLLDFLLPDWLEVKFGTADTNRDIVQIPPEIETANIKEIEIAEDGDHTIYCMVIPALDAALAPDSIRLGGGLRKIELCGNLRPQGEEPRMALQEADITRAIKNVFCCDDDGTVGAGAGAVVGADPDADGDGVVSQSERNASNVGGAYGLLYGLRQLHDDIDDILSAAPTADEIAQASLYLQLVYGFEAADADAYIATISGIVFRFDPTDNYAESIFCGVQEGLLPVQALQKLVFVSFASTDNEFEQFTTLLDALPSTIVDQWLVSGVPRDDWRKFACYIREDDTIEYATSDYGTAKNTTIGIPTSERLFEIEARGFFTYSDGSIRDGLYHVDPNGNVSYQPPVIEIANFTNLNADNGVTPEAATRPPYNENHIYKYDRIPNASVAGAIAVLKITDNRAAANLVDDGSIITYTLRDLGNSI